MPGEATATCWSCGTMRAVHFCSACGKVQPPVPVDYFTFFGLPRKLNLDTALLEHEFYELSRKLHPDLNARADQREQEWSLEQSSLLNDAYRTLKDPIKRTEYLLRLEGVELEEQSKTATEKARATGEIKKQVVPLPPPPTCHPVVATRGRCEAFEGVSGRRLASHQTTGTGTDELVVVPFPSWP